MNASDIAEVAEKQDVILYRNNNSIDLINYNISKLMVFLSKYDEKEVLNLLNKKYIKKNNYKDINSFIREVVYRCPNCILIIQHYKLDKIYGTLINYLNKCLNPDEEIINNIENINKKYDLKIEDHLKDKI